MVNGEWYVVVGGNLVIGGKVVGGSGYRWTKIRNQGNQVIKKIKVKNKGLVIV